LLTLFVKNNPPGISSNTSSVVPTDATLAQHQEQLSLKKKKKIQNFCSVFRCMTLFLCFTDSSKQPPEKRPSVVLPKSNSTEQQQFTKEDFIIIKPISNGAYG